MSIIYDKNMDKDSFKKEIGFKIKVERMRKKISQEKLAEMVI